MIGFERFYRGGGDVRSIAQRLGELKQRGCVTVATGDAPTEAMQALCRRMFGDANLDRRRLLVAFDRDPSPSQWLPADVGADHESVTVRDRSAEVREVAATARRKPGVTGDDLDDLAKSHLDAVAADILDVASGMVATEPGRLRVVVVRPDHLFPDPDRQSLTVLSDFASRLRTLMRRFGGMALLVVPRREDPAVVEHLREVADVEFEVRSKPKFVEHRVVVGPGTTDPLRSGWHELP